MRKASIDDENRSRLKQGATPCKDSVISNKPHLFQRDSLSGLKKSASKPRTFHLARIARPFSRRYVRPTQRPTLTIGHQDCSRRRKRRLQRLPDADKPIDECTCSLSLPLYGSIKGR